MLKAMNQSINMDDLIQRAQALFSDPDGDLLIAGMDESGVDLSVICAMDDANIKSFTFDLAQRQNKAIGRIAQKYPDRVFALAGIDPRRPEAPKMMRECFEEFGMKGLKYHPDSGYDPSGPDSYKLLEIVEGNKGILLTHTGPLAPPSRAKYADPMLLADIAVDFPNLKVIAAHMGYINWRPWAALAAHQPNLYGDLAMWDVFAFSRYDLFCQELRNIIDLVGIEKVLFGTDDPVNKVVRSTKAWIQMIRDLPKDAPEGIQFKQEEADAILGDNAAALLGLENH